jgi:hypothetical protein
MYRVDCLFSRMTLLKEIRSPPNLVYEMFLPSLSHQCVQCRYHSKFVYVDRHICAIW